jgi:hypothetical protein
MRWGRSANGDLFTKRLSAGYIANRKMLTAAIVSVAAKESK